MDIIFSYRFLHIHNDKNKDDKDDDTKKKTEEEEDGGVLGVPDIDPVNHLQKLLLPLSKVSSSNCLNKTSQHTILIFPWNSRDRGLAGGNTDLC